MPNLLILSVNQPRVSIPPGTSGELALTVQNLSTLLDQVTLTIQGVNPEWVQIIPPTLPVFAQGQASARLLFTIPIDIQQAVAGVYPLTISGVMQENKGQQAEISAELEIQLVGDYRLLMEHGESVNEHDMRYPLRVQNGANALLQVRLSSSDENNAAWYKFDPYILKIPPAMEVAARLTTRPKQLDESEHLVKFNLITQGEFLPEKSPAVPAPEQQVEGQFVQVAAPKKYARLHMSIQPATVESRTEGIYQLTLSNSGNLESKVRLSGSDQGQALTYEFESTDVDLPPGKESRVKLVVRPVNPKRKETVAFRIIATPTDGSESAMADASYTHLVKFPYAILIGAALIACIGWIALATLVWWYLQPRLH